MSKNLLQTFTTHTHTNVLCIFVFARKMRVKKMRKASDLMRDCARCCSPGSQTIFVFLFVLFFFSFFQIFIVVAVIAVGAVYS